MKPLHSHQRIYSLTHIFFHQEDSRIFFYLALEDENTFELILHVQDKISLNTPVTLQLLCIEKVMSFGYHYLKFNGNEDNPVTEAGLYTPVFQWGGCSERIWS